MPKTKSKKHWGGFFPEYELRRRETGFNHHIGWEGKLKYSLYSSLHPCNSWDPINSHNEQIKYTGVHHGGIFNLEFSPDGSQLVAACEKKAIMIFDPLTRRKIHDVTCAHNSCVNGIKFLDNRVFATCSDDKTVALWDVRNLRKEIVRFYGHDNWVKNIEYSGEDGLLITSGFDERILGWNINRYAEDNAQYSELFSMPGLMRIKLTPDLSKLIICTTCGYLVVIHNLCLKSLVADLRDFKITNPPFPLQAYFTKFFSRKRNRIEIISDFPAGNDADVIHSLQVHPQGWCVLSRNTSVGSSSEWTCVHDIQEMDVEYEDAKALPEDLPAKGKNLNSSGRSSVNRNSFYVSSSSPPSDQARNSNEERSRDVRLAFTISPRVEVMLRQMPQGEDDDDDEEQQQLNNERRRRRRRNRETVVQSGNFEDSGFDLQVRLTSMDVLEALDHIELRQIEQWRRSGRPREEIAGPSGMSTGPANRYERGSLRNQEDEEEEEEEDRAASPHQDFRLRQRRDTEGRAENRGDYRSVFFIRPEIYSLRSLLVLPPWNKIAKNVPRLTNYIEEPNKGKGFIKELCFSADGRLICSPFDCGVRLMMFDDKCSELSHCVQKDPQPLCTVSNNMCHTNCVVSTKFSPVDCLLVSGCLNGKIVWHQPII